MQHHDSFIFFGGFSCAGFFRLSRSLYLFSRSVLLFLKILEARYQPRVHIRLVCLIYKLNGECCSSFPPESTPFFSNGAELLRTPNFLFSFLLLLRSFVRLWPRLTDSADTVGGIRAAATAT